MHKRGYPMALFLMVPGTLSACPGDRKAVQGMLGQLHQKKRRILEDGFRRAQRENKRLAEERHRLEADLGALLAAPGFDRRTYLDKSAKLGTLRAKMRANFDDAIAWVAELFTPAERTVIRQMRTLEERGDPEEWSRQDEEINHQPEAEE